MAASVRTLLDRLPEARSLSRRERARALQLLTPTKLLPGAVLYAQDDAPQQLALLLTGSMVVTTATSDGAELALGRVGPGEVIGEMGLLDGAPRSATVTCERPATLLTLDRGGFEELEATADPVLVWLLDIAARGMARRIGAMSERIAAVALDAQLLHHLPAASAQRSLGLWAWLDALRGRP